jgi:hypothetical protein
MPFVCRATLENCQSEFLQLTWQIAGLAILLSVGSPSRVKAMSAKKRSKTQTLALT